MPIKPMSQEVRDLYHQIEDLHEDWLEIFRMGHSNFGQNVEGQLLEIEAEIDRLEDEIAEIKSREA